MCDITQYKYKLQGPSDPAPYYCVIYSFTYSKKWLASYLMPNYSPVWDVLEDTTGVNILYPLPDLKVFEVFIDFTKGSPPTVSVVYQSSPKTFFKLESIQPITFAEAKIPAQYESMCDIAPLPIRKPTTWRWWLGVALIILGALLVVGGVTTIIVVLMKRRKLGS